MNSEHGLMPETVDALRANQLQRVEVSRRLLAAHRRGDMQAMHDAQAELTALHRAAVEIQAAGAAS